MTILAVDPIVIMMGVFLILCLGVIFLVSKIAWEDKPKKVDKLEEEYQIYLEHMKELDAEPEPIESFDIKKLKDTNFTLKTVIDKFLKH